MEGLLVSAATGALKPVLEKLTALMGDEYKRFKRVRREVQSLMDELAAMHSFLLKMSEEENPDPQDKNWMKEVRELSYDMEDILDEFMLHVDDKSISPEGFIDKFKTFLIKVRNRRRIAKVVEDLKVQVKEVGDRNKRYKSNETIMNTSNATMDHRALAIFEDASKLVGIDEPKAELMKWLARKYQGVASEPLEVEPPKVVSIIGFEGMGKTTLANQVYVELKNQFDFDCWAFVSVSRNPDMMKILRTILSDVSNKPYASTEAGSIQQIIGTITDFLKDKRYLIVVDDIWKIKTWDIIRVQNSFGHELGKNPEVQSMVQILSLSYFDLPHHLKTCLLYLGTFREDFVIDKRCLIRGWIAEGFIQEEQGCTLYELGERCFNELINRNLIQAQHINMYGEITVCQVHDTILDFIISKSEEENFVTIFSDGYQMPGPHRKVRRLSLHSNSVENVSQLKDLDLSHLRPVTMFSYAAEVLLLFPSFSSLRVLDLGGCTQVESHHLANIGNLFRLKYLILCNTKVCELPEQIRKLQHLETLDISMGKSRKLPASIVELKRLAHLVVDRGVVLPSGIRSMTALEQLEGVDVFKQPIDFAQELGHLTLLRSISFFSNPNDRKKFDMVEDVMALGCLPALVFLRLIAHESFHGRWFTISGGDRFHSLRHFDFGCAMPVMFGAGAMPMLEKFTIMFSPERMGLLMGTGVFHFGIQHLSNLDQVECIFYLNSDSVVVRTTMTRMANISFRQGMDTILNQVIDATCDIESAVSAHTKSPKLKFRHTHEWKIED
ncbi:unnamed protein product [Miscanthus lutarioriparius]|uniref:Uncharacterized protein n=1 Tax=Miscanthus lutarioriparius TaxID=422564 RepID=A0A811R337_9POAL|nr:unnamed protein product [Miscanthus lutarioriparius]